MNIFTKITLRSLRRNKLRTLMTIVGVTLSVAMISGVLAFATSFQYFMVQYEKQMTGDWYARVYAPKKIELLKAQRDDRTDRIGTYQEIGYLKVEGMEDHYKPYIQVLDPDVSLDAMTRVRLVEGRMPRNSHELVLPITIAAGGGRPLKLGEKISGDLGIRVAGEKSNTPEGTRLTADKPYEEGEVLHVLGRREYTIVGISEGVNVISYSSPGYMGISVADKPTEFSDDQGESIVAYVKTKKPDAITSYMSEFFPNGAVEFNNNLLLYLGATHFGAFSALLTIVSGLLIFLIMIGSIALIYNAVAISVGERTKDYGLLSSIGATAKQRRFAVFTEGLLISLIGIPLGMLLGIGGIGLALKVMGKYTIGIGGGVDIRGFGLHIHFPILLLMIGLSLVTVLISVAVPAARASKVSIISTIRRGRYIREENHIFKVPKVVARRLNFEQDLSNKYFRQSGRKYRATIISLTLSMTLFLSANFAGSYFLDAGETGTNSSPLYDVEYLHAIGQGSVADLEKGEEIFDKISAAPGITYIRDVEYATLYSDAKESKAEIPVVIMSDKDYKVYLISIGAADASLPTTLLEKEPSSDKKGISLYTKDKKRFVIGQKNLVARAVTGKNVPPGGGQFSYDQMIVMSRQTASDTFGNYQGLLTSRGMFFKCQDPAKTYAAMEKICREEGYPTNSLNNATGNAKDAKNLVIMINVFAYGFVVLISLIAIVNVFNTMSTNIMVRRREFAVLRAVGMTEKSFRRMLSYESLIYGIRSLVLSMGISLIISILLYRIFWLGAGLSYLVPWRAIIISIVIVFLAVFATMTYAVGKINSGNFIEELKKENL